MLTRLHPIAATVLLCLAYYAAGWSTVQLLWPLLSALPFMQNVAPWIPALIANATAFLVLFTITHMQRGHIDPQRRNFLWIYMGICLAYSLSTLHPSQYNEGAASLQMAFVYMAAVNLVRMSKLSSRA